MDTRDDLVCPRCGLPMPAARERHLSIVEEAESALRAARAAQDLHDVHTIEEGEDG
jgi:hypothetical protein